MNTENKLHPFETDELYDRLDEMKLDQSWEQIVQRCQKIAKDNPAIFLPTPNSIIKSPGLYLDAFLRAYRSMEEDRSKTVSLELSEKEVQERFTRELKMHFDKSRKSNTDFFYIDSFPFTQTGSRPDSTSVSESEYPISTTYSGGSERFHTFFNLNHYEPQYTMIESGPKEESEIAQLHRRKHGKVAIPKKKKKDIKTSSILDKLIRKVQK